MNEKTKVYYNSVFDSKKFEHRLHSRNETLVEAKTLWFTFVEYVESLLLR